MNFFLQAILFILPAYVANSTASVFGGGARIDFDSKFMGKPLFGKGKTWRGFVLGTLLGTSVGFSIAFIFPSFLGGNFFTISFLTSFGALFGDLCFSFVKRRLGMKRGAPFPIIDQLDFLLGAIVFGSFIHLPDLATILFLIILTPAVHLTANYIAFKLGIKKEPY